MSIRVHPWLKFFVFAPIFLLNTAAQEVLAPRPPEYSPPTNTAIINGLPVMPSSTNNLESPGSAMASVISQPSTIDHQLSPFSIGPAQLRPHPFYRFSYGNGIQPTPGHQTVTAVNEVAPGILIDIGQHWHLDYTPTLRFYSAREFRDSTDHAVNLNWGTTYKDWTTSFSQSYDSSSTPLAETGSQTGSETYATTLGAVYQLNSRVTIDFALNQNFRYLESITTNQPLANSRTWSTTEGFSYQIAPPLTAGLSVTFAYDNLDIGSDMTSEQLQARLNWRPGTKLSFALSAGFEDRQFLDAHIPDSLTPIFSLSAVYEPFEVTTITLSANRTVTPSYFQNQITESTAFTASLHQRVLEKLFLNVSAGFGDTTYESSAAAVSVNREDTHANIDVRLTCPFLKRGTAAIFYDWTDHSSSEKGFQYTSNQGGLELGWRY